MKGPMNTHSVEKKSSWMNLTFLPSSKSCSLFFCFSLFFFLLLRCFLLSDPLIEPLRLNPLFTLFRPIP